MSLSSLINGNNNDKLFQETIICRQILGELHPGEWPPGELSLENCPHPKSNLNLKLNKAKSILNFLWSITKEVQSPKNCNFRYSRSCKCAEVWRRGREPC